MESVHVPKATLESSAQYVDHQRYKYCIIIYCYAYNILYDVYIIIMQ